MAVKVDPIAAANAVINAQESARSRLELAGIKPLLRHFKAPLRLCSGSIEARLRLY
jgi:hypothetical protein